MLLSMSGGAFGMHTSETRGRARGTFWGGFHRLIFSEWVGEERGLPVALCSQRWRIWYVCQRGGRASTRDLLGGASTIQSSRSGWMGGSILSGGTFGIHLSGAAGRARQTSFIFCTPIVQLYWRVLCGERVMVALYFWRRCFWHAHQRGMEGKRTRQFFCTLPPFNFPGMSVGGGGVPAALYSQQLRFMLHTSGAGVRACRPFYLRFRR